MVSGLSLLSLERSDILAPNDRGCGILGTLIARWGSTSEIYMINLVSLYSLVLKTAEIINQIIELLYSTIKYTISKM